MTTRDNPTCNPYPHRYGTAPMCVRNECVACDACIWERAYEAGRLSLAKEAKWPAVDDDDLALPEDDAIHAAFPTRSGRHDLYGEAMRLVGAKRSKGALVALVNWLLTLKATKAERAVVDTSMRFAHAKTSGERAVYNVQVDQACVALAKERGVEKPEKRPAAPPAECESCGHPTSWHTTKYGCTDDSRQFPCGCKEHGQ